MTVGFAGAGRRRARGTAALACSGPGDGGILALLRSATGRVHRRAEAHIERIEDQIDVSGYKALLGVLLPVYSTVETRLGSFEEWSTLSPPLDIALRRRSHLLVADLRSLGIDADAHCILRIDHPPLEHFGQAFGALYVLEGSRLGGVVLARRISRANASLGPECFRFLRSDGADVGALWRQLRASLAAFGADRARQDGLLEGAVATFACFDDQLARWSR